MPDTSTEVAIATTTLGSATSTITFDSITSAYTDLKLIIVGTTTSAGTFANLRFNNISTTTYSFTALYGDGATAVATSQQTINSIKIFNNISGAGMSTTIPQFSQIDIFSYAGSTNKSVIETNFSDYNGSGIIINRSGLWRSTSAITRIDLIMQTGNWSAGTTATLYGIL